MTEGVGDLYYPMNFLVMYEFIVREDMDAEAKNFSGIERTSVKHTLPLHASPFKIIQSQLN